jgi:phosphoribosylamine--glycine ligase
VVGLQLKDAQEAKNYARLVLSQKIGGEGVIIEEKLEGEEFTLQCFCDGRTLIPMPAVQDHKRAGVGDVGPNTGGMGSYTGTSHLLPFLSQKHYDEAFKILQKVARILELEANIHFLGVIYGQFMLTAKGVYLIEINARFGDPEAINVLALLRTPLSEILQSISSGRLAKTKVKFAKMATVVKYLVPEGYPQKAIPPSLISIDQKKLKASKARLFYSSVDSRPDGIYSGSSRSLALLGVGKTIDEAQKRAEAGCLAISGPLWHRPDIGTKELISKKLEHVKQLLSK